MIQSLRVMSIQPRGTELKSSIPSTSLKGSYGHQYGGSLGTEGQRQGNPRNSLRNSLLIILTQSFMFNKRPEQQKHGDNRGRHIALSSHVCTYAYKSHESMNTCTQSHIHDQKQANIKNSACAQRQALIFVTTASLSEGMMLGEESLPVNHVSHMSTVNIYIIILYRT